MSKLNLVLDFKFNHIAISVKDVANSIAIIKTNKAVHFALSTPYLDVFIQHLNDLNIEYSDWRGTPTKDYIRKDGIAQVYFQDPDGYWIEVNNGI